MISPRYLTCLALLAAACGNYSISRAIMSAPDYAYGTFHTLWSGDRTEIEAEDTH